MPDRLSETYVPHFGSDLKTGLQGEAWVYNLKNHLVNGTLEQGYCMYDENEMNHDTKYGGKGEDDLTLTVVPKRILTRGAWPTKDKGLLASTVLFSEISDEGIFNCISDESIKRFGKVLPSGHNAKFDFERTQYYSDSDVLFRKIIFGSIEVKADYSAIKYGNLFFEYECLLNDVWKPSGILVTEADIWAHIVGYGYSTIFLETKVLRLVLEYALKNNMTKEMARGDHWTKGACIPYKDFFNIVKLVTT